MDIAPEIQAPQEIQAGELPPGELSRLERAAALGSLDDLLRLASYHAHGPESARDMGKARGMLILADLGGHPEVRTLGLTIERWLGAGPFPDPAEATDIVREEAKSGDPKSICRWAMLVASDQIPSEPWERSHDLFRAAASGGHRPAAALWSQILAERGSESLHAEEIAGLLRTGASENCRDCLVALAAMIQKGLCPAASGREAFDLCLAAARLGSEFAQLKLAMDFSALWGPSEAGEPLRWLMAAAAAGNPFAQALLGQRFERGDGVAKSAAEALGLYKQSLLRGNAAGYGLVAACHAFGHASVQDYAEARLWAARGSQLGDPISMTVMHHLLTNGLGGPADKSKGMEILERAVDLGHPDAFYAMSVALSSEAGGHKSSPRISALLREAAELGSVVARRDLGIKLFYGQGLPRSLPGAWRWLSLAAEAGETLSQLYVAYMLYHGEGVDKNPALAAAWMARAAAQGDLRSQQALFNMHFTGDLIPKNVPLAIEYAKMAAAQGDMEAVRALANIYWRGLGVPIDRAAAEQLMRKAAEQGDARAARDLEAVAAGRLLSKDINKVIRLGPGPGPVLGPGHGPGRWMRIGERPNGARTPSPKPAKRSRKLLQQMAKAQKKGQPKGGKSRKH